MANTHESAEADIDFALFAFICGLAGGGEAAETRGLAAADW